MTRFDDKEELYDSIGRKYQSGQWGLVVFTAELVKLGYNATEIAIIERQYRPSEK